MWTYTVIACFRTFVHPPQLSSSDLGATARSVRSELHSCELLERDEVAGEFDEGLVVGVAADSPSFDGSTLLRPGDSLYDRPSLLAQAARVVFAAFRDLASTQHTSSKLGKLAEV